VGTKELVEDFGDPFRPNRVRVSVGDGCSLSPLAAIGGVAQHPRARPGPRGRIRIGNRVVIRAFATVHLPLVDGGETVIGDDCYLMVKSHVAHDCVLGREVTLSNSVDLAGHVHVHEGATLGLGAVVRQHQVIGAYAMVGAGAVVVDDVPPFAKMIGNPARYLDVNRVGMERAGFTTEEITAASSLLSVASDDLVGDRVVRGRLQEVAKKGGWKWTERMVAHARQFVDESAGVVR
jgi:UDP-N-acetylglucosamine acyltransferase